MTTDLKATSTDLFRPRDEVREIEERITHMLPGGDKLNKQQKLALAQGAVAHSLDPFNGEIWIIPGSGLMIGIKGLRKKAHEQVKGNFWVEFRQVLNTEERAGMGIKDAAALVFEARLFDSENIRTYADTAQKLLKAGIPWEAVKSMIGDKPYTIGIGVFRLTEKTRMEPVQCAMKRAEADAIKRRFDVPFGLTIGAGDDSDADEYGGEWANAIDGEATAVDPLRCACGHTEEEHGQHGCETCECVKFTDERLARGKASLGRDDTGLG